MDQYSSSRADPDDAAIAWLTRLRGAPTTAEQTAFEQWLAASPAHHAAWRRAERIWSVTGDAGVRVAEEDTAQLSAYLDKMDRAKRRKVLRKASTVAGILVALFGGALWLERPYILDDLTADYVSARGERRLITLSDASTILLDADSALDVDYADNSRRVTLRRGTAFFSVAKTGAPFTVETAQGNVRVLGTEFDLKLDDKGAVITLAQGRVEVGASRRTATLSPGQQVHFSLGAIGGVTNADLDAALAWRDGRFVFYEARLADVIAEIGRYRPGRIIITSNKVADWVVSGSLPLDDPDAALRSLQSSVGFSMRSITGRLVVLY